MFRDSEPGCLKSYFLVVVTRFKAIFNNTERYCDNPHVQLHLSNGTVPRGDVHPGPRLHPAPGPPAQDPHGVPGQQAEHGPPEQSHQQVDTDCDSSFQNKIMDTFSVRLWIPS